MRAGHARRLVALALSVGVTFMPTQVQPQGRSVSPYAAASMTLFMRAGELVECGVDSLTLREGMERFALRTTTGLLATGVVAVAIVAVGPGALGPSTVVATG